MALKDVASKLARTGGPVSGRATVNARGVGPGFAALCVDGAVVPTKPWPRLERFREHDIELPVAELTVSAENEAALRVALHRALDYGKGLIHVLPPRRGARAQVFSTRRACPVCNRSFPELDPRLFSFNSKHGWCPSCYGKVAIRALSGDEIEPAGTRLAWLAGTFLAGWAHAWYEATVGFVRKPAEIDQ